MVLRDVIVIIPNGLTAIVTNGLMTIVTAEVICGAQWEARGNVQELTFVLFVIW